MWRDWGDKTNVWSDWGGGAKLMCGVTGTSVESCLSMCSPTPKYLIGMKQFVWETESYFNRS